jgi:hypothetical protein
MPTKEEATLRPLHKVGPSCWRTDDGRYEIWLEREDAWEARE